MLPCHYGKVYAWVRGGIIPQKMTVELWLLRTEVWRAEHGRRMRLIIGVVIGLHKSLCMFRGVISETRPLGEGDTLLSETNVLEVDQQQE